MDSSTVKEKCQQVIDDIAYERLVLQANIIKGLVGTRKPWPFSRYTYQTAFEYLENQDPTEWPTRIQTRYNVAKVIWQRSLDDCKKLIGLASHCAFVTVTDDHIYIFTDN